MNKLQAYAGATLLTLAGCASAVKTESMQQPTTPVPLSQAASPEQQPVVPVPISQAANPQPEINNIYQKVCQALIDSLDDDMGPIELGTGVTINSTPVIVRRTDWTSERLGAAVVECNIRNAPLSDLLAGKSGVDRNVSLKIVEGKFAAAYGGEKDPRLKKPLVFSIDAETVLMSVDTNEDESVESEIFYGKPGGAPNDLTSRFEDLARKVLGFLMSNKKAKAPDRF